MCGIFLTSEEIAMADKPSDSFSTEPLPPAPNPESGTEGEITPDIAKPASTAQILELQQRGNKGANWFFWVAGLSIVNSLIMHGGGETYFVVGLGVTLTADITATAISQQHPDLEVIARGFAMAFTVVSALIVAVFGWLARRGMLVLYGVGMFLYLLDGLLFLLYQDYLSVAFHAFALVCMWSGFSAFRQVNVIQEELQARLATDRRRESR
jgi:hypothetical protein